MEKIRLNAIVNIKNSLFMTTSSFWNKKKD